MGKHRKKEIGLIIRKQKSGKLYEDEVMRMTSSFCFPGDCPLRLLQYSKPPCVPSACSSGSFALPLSAAFKGASVVRSATLTLRTMKCISLTALNLTAINLEHLFNWCRFIRFTHFFELTLQPLWDVFFH